MTPPNFWGKVQIWAWSCKSRAFYHFRNQSLKGYDFLYDDRRHPLSMIMSYRKKNLILGLRVGGLCVRNRVIFAIFAEMSYERLLFTAWWVCVMIICSLLRKVGSITCILAYSSVSIKRPLPLRLLIIGNFWPKNFQFWCKSEVPKYWLSR